MNILFVSALMPYPLYSGGQVRIFNLLKRLSHQHRITLYAFIRDHKEEQYTKELSFCHKVEVVYRGHAWQMRYILSSLGKYPFLLSTYSNGEMRQKLMTEIASQQYDLMHIEPWYVYPSLPSSSLPLVVAEHNIEYSIYEQYVKSFSFVPLKPLLSWDVWKLRQWEETVWQKANHVVAVSEDEQQIISKKTETPVSVVANGVDVESFTFRPKRIDPGRLRFLFVGYFGWLQNRDAVNYLLTSLWPRIITHFPDAQLTIVGKKMPQTLKRAVSAAGAVLLEEVPTIQEAFQAADIVLAPIRVGGGTKFKILEAMAAGVPVITTTIGAAGLNIQSEKELFIADSPEEQLNAIIRLVEDRSLQISITRAARKKVETTYAWDRIAKELSTVWEKTYEESHTS